MQHLLPEPPADFLAICENNCWHPTYIEKQRGLIQLGYLFDLPPLSALDESGKGPTLYSMVLEYFRSRYSEDDAVLYAAQYIPALYSALEKDAQQDG